MARGSSSVTLDGEGWAVGTMLEPAAGRLLLGRSVAELTDRWVDLTGVDGVPSSLVPDVRAAMAASPRDPAAHAAAIAVVERWLTAYLPVDEQGLLINQIVTWLRHNPDVTRVEHVAREFGLTERSLQRLVEQRVGLTPKWLVKRRRLHDAVQALKSGNTTLADVAAELGYSDQAHFTHDFRAVTGMTPGHFLRDQRSTPPHT